MTLSFRPFGRYPSPACVLLSQLLCFSFARLMTAPSLGHVEGIRAGVLKSMAEGQTTRACSIRDQKRKEDKRVNRGS